MVRDMQMHWGDGIWYIYSGDGMQHVSFVEVLVESIGLLRHNYHHYMQPVGSVL